MLFDDRLEIREYGMNDDYKFYSKKNGKMFLSFHRQETVKSLDLGGE